MQAEYKQNLPQMRTKYDTKTRRGPETKHNKKYNDIRKIRHLRHDSKLYFIRHILFPDFEPSRCQYLTQ